VPAKAQVEPAYEVRRISRENQAAVWISETIYIRIGTVNIWQMSLGEEERWVRWWDEKRQIRLNVLPL